MLPYATNQILHVGADSISARTLKGSLCETDSPDTGEVARSARRGALSAKLTEGESLAKAQSFG